MIMRTIHGTFYYVGKAVIMAVFLYEKNRRAFTLSLKISGRKKCYCIGNEGIAHISTAVKGTATVGAVAGQQARAGIPERCHSCLFYLQIIGKSFSI